MTPTGYLEPHAAFAEPSSAPAGIDKVYADDIRKEHGDLTGDSTLPSGPDDEDKPRRLTELDVEQAPQNGADPGVESNQESGEAR